MGIINQSFGFNIRVLKAFYLYPPEKQSYLYKIKTYVLYVIFVVVIPTISIMNLIISEDLDVERASYNAAFLAQTTNFITEFLPFVVIGDRIKRCINYFENFQAEKKQHQLIMNECIRICRRNTWGFFICGLGAMGSWATKPIFWEGRNFPVDVWLPFDATTNILTYFFVYLFVTAGPLYAALATTVINPLMAGLAYHATAQIKILKDNLQHISDYASEEIPKEKVDSRLLYTITQKKIYTGIKKCVEHHDNILEFVKEFEACFTWVLFSQLAASVFVLCFCCLQISKVDSFGYYVFQLMTYLTAVLLEIYFYCYYGFTISDECESLADAIYMSEWYNYDIKNQKVLLTLMERSKRPVVVTAGKLIDLSLVTFTTILRRSYSLLALLKNYQ